MPAYTANELEAIREIAEVENALFDGFPPTTRQGSHQVGCFRAAADRLHCHALSLRDRVGRPDRPGYHHNHYGLTVYWGMYREPVVQSIQNTSPDTPESQLEPQPSVSADPIVVRRMLDEITNLRASLKEAERRAAEAEDVRGKILGLSSVPLRPRIMPPMAGGHSGRQAVILHLSDLHCGEVIRAPEILGANRYDIGIFRARLGRLFATASRLCTEHWPRGDDPPVEIIVCLGGDHISGSIHQELAETNDGTDYEIFRECAERIAGGLTLLRAETELPIRVMTVPGNHGRQSMKPRAKQAGMRSWDILVADFAEAAMKHDPGVTWYRSEGTDVYFDAVGWPFLLSHGDNMGARGGMGFLGPMATILRGQRKTVDTEFRQRRPVYMVLSGHMHTTGLTPFGASNGSLIGYSEYARSLRSDPEPAKQNFLVIHERMGLIRYHPIYVGDPSEGTIYQGFTGWLTPQMVDEASHGQGIP